MARQRRTAAEAMALPTSVEQFITRGVPNMATPATSRNPLANENSRQEPVGRQDDQPEGDHGFGSSRKPRKVPRQQSRQTSGHDDLTRMLAKATVQKTVRFQPRLVAEWEAYVRRQEASGHATKPFQQVQNEALELWLEKNVPRK
jgi:hypothetical protein